MFDSKIITYSPQELQKIDIKEIYQFVFPNGYPKILTWSDKRQVEFLLARSTIKKLCLKNNVEIAKHDLYQKDDRQCQWPKGIIGSISHARHPRTKELSIYVAISDEHQYLGVDIEYLDRFQDTKIHSQVLSESEKQLIQDESLKTPLLNLSKEEFFTGIIFSAKESLFKALYPICQTYFGFKDASISTIISEELKGKLIRELPLVTKKDFSITYQLYKNEMCLTICRN